MFSLTAWISSFFCLFSFVFLDVKSRMEDNNVAPAIDQPTGPAKASNALPAVIPPPPAARAPPPSQASAALVAAAPESVEIAAPVEAVPNVVATHIAAVGAMNATDAPAARPAPAPAAAFRASCSSRSAKSRDSVNFLRLTEISSNSASKLLGRLAMLLTRLSTKEIESRERHRSMYSCTPLSFMMV